MRDFPELFKGRETAHGYYGDITGAQPTDRGKRTSLAKSVKEPVTPELWALHRAGKKRLGIIVVNEKGLCHWGAIDFDFYQDPKMLEEVCTEIKTQGLPLVGCFSKSNGGHFFLFPESPIPAGKIIEILKAYAEKLGLPTEHVEIFPKNTSTEDIAVWMNMPYFGEACYCFGEDGKQHLTAEEFLVYANDRITDLADLEHKKKEKAKTVKSDQPPCIDYMEANGVEEGNRDLAMFQYIVFAKKKWPDDWKEHAEKFNEDHLHPPLRRDELAKSFKSQSRRDYDYNCKAVKAIFCDGKACKRRAFGVGASEEVDVGIESIEKIDGENPIYRVTIEGKTFTVTFNQLFSYVQFRPIAFACVNRFLPPLGQAQWEDALKEPLDQMAITTAATDTEMRDRVIAAFQNWAKQTTVTDNLQSALDARAPYYDGKRILFLGDDFMTIIDRNLKVPRDRVFLYMRGWGVVQQDEAGQKLWCWPQNGPLWFNPSKEEMA